VLPVARFVPAAVVLEPGDTLLLYTDGLTEARVGPGRALYGEDGLREFLTGCVGAAPAAVVDALARLLAGFGDGVTDDVALLAIGVPPERP
jgi:sigma-B regulation protein RsbU (phosphoserine phosphatase)